MGELAVFLGKLGIFLCVISVPIIMRAFLSPIKASFIEGLFCFKLVDFELFKEIINEIKERLNSENKDSFDKTFKFWFANILALGGILVTLIAYIAFYIGLICLNFGLILVLIYYNFK